MNFFNGDEEFSLKAEKRMAQLVQDANVFVFSSHAHGVIKAYCNRFIKMENGRAFENISFRFLVFSTYIQTLRKGIL